MAEEAAARICVLHLQLDQSAVSNPGDKDRISETIQESLKEFKLKKVHRIVLKDGIMDILAEEQGSITCTLRIYDSGMVTLALEEGTADPKLTNQKMDDFGEVLKAKMNQEIEKFPVFKLGMPINNYFISTDNRLLENDYDKVLYEAQSPYQQIKILHSPSFGNCLILDGYQNLSESDINYTHGLMKYGEMSYTGKDILILGGGDGALLHELLKEDPKFVTMVDIDKMVIDACRIHLRKCCGDTLDNLKGKNYEVIVDDCIKIMDQYQKQGKTFDVIFNDLTDIPISTTPQGELWDFIRKILEMSLEILRPDGRYFNHAVGVGAVETLKTYEGVLESLPVKVEFSTHNRFVPSFLERWVFYEIWKAQ